MFVHINPEPASAQESLCSLKFAAKVNGCETAAKGGARRNVTSGAAPQLSAQVWGMVGPNCVSSCVCVCVCVSQLVVQYDEARHDSWCWSDGGVPEGLSVSTC